MKKWGKALVCMSQIYCLYILAHYYKFIVGFQQDYPMLLDREFAWCQDKACQGQIAKTLKVEIYEKYKNQEISGKAGATDSTFEEVPTTAASHSTQWED